MTKQAAKKHTITVPHSLWEDAGGSPMRLRELIYLGLKYEQERSSMRDMHGSVDPETISWYPRWQVAEFAATCTVGNHVMRVGEEYQFATIGVRPDGHRIYARRCREHAD